MADQNGLDVINDYLKKAFYDSKEPGAYTSASTLWNNVKSDPDKPKGLTHKRLIQWLNKQETYQMHKLPPS
jgi:hypothetical protein